MCSFRYYKIFPSFTLKIMTSNFEKYYFKTKDFLVYMCFYNLFNCTYKLTIIIN